MASGWISLAEAARRLQIDPAIVASWRSVGRLNVELDESGQEGVSDVEFARLERLAQAVRGDFADSAGADLADGHGLADSSHLARTEADSGATMLEESSILGGAPDRPVEVRSAEPDSQVLNEDEKIPEAVRRMIRRNQRGAPSETEEDAAVEVFGGSSLNTGVLGDDADQVGGSTGGSQTSLSESELLSDVYEDDNDDSSTSVNSRAAPPTVPGGGYTDDSYLGGDALSLPMDFETPAASPASLGSPARKSAAMPENFDDDDSLFGNLEEPTKKPAAKKGSPPPSGDAMNTPEDDLLLHAPDLDEGLEIPALEDPSMHLGQFESSDREMSISLDEGMLSPLARENLDAPTFDLGPSPPSDYASDMSMSIELELDRPGRPARKGAKETPSASDGELDLTPLSGASGIDLESLLSNKSDVQSGDEPTLDLIPHRKDRAEAMVDLENLSLDSEDATEVSDPKTSVLSDSGSSSMSSGGSSLQLGDEIQQVGSVSGVNLDREGGPASGGSDLFSLSEAAPRTGGGASLVNLGEVTDEDDFVLDGAGGSDVTLRPSESGIGIGAGQSGIGLLSRGDSGIDLADGGLDLGSTTMGAVQADSEFLLEPMEEGETDDGSSSGSQVIALDDGGEPGMAPMLGPDDAGVMLPGDGFGYPASGVGLGMSPGMGMGALPASPSLVGGGMATGMTAPAAIVQPVVEYDDGIRYDGWDMFLFVTCAVLGLTSAIMAYELIAVTVLGQRAFTIDWLLNPVLQTPPGEI